MSNAFDGLQIDLDSLLFLQELRATHEDTAKAIFQIVIDIAPYIRKNGYRPLLSHIDSVLWTHKYTSLVENRAMDIILQMCNHYWTTHYRSAAVRDRISDYIMDIMGHGRSVTQGWEPIPYKFNKLF